MQECKFTMSIVIVCLISIVLNSCLWANSLPVDLYKQAIKGKENIVISPFGTSYAFAIAFVGSRGNTADEIARVFGFSKDNQKFDSTMAFTLNNLKEIVKTASVELSFSAALWPSTKYHLESSFLKRSQDILNNIVEPLNFTNSSDACNIINNWVVQATNGKANSIISPSDISSITNMIITSAVYFKGKWEKQFIKQLTEDRPFFLSKIDSIQAPTMQQTDYFGYWANDNIQYLKMNYIDKRISMAIILPCKRVGLAALEQSLTMDSLSIWADRSQSTKVEVFLPKFRFSAKTDIKQKLHKLGIVSAFNYKNADFSGISGHQDSLFVEKVLQKAFILLDEEGTEASSIDALLAGIGGLRTTPPPPIPVFRADHPFLFVIDDNSTGTILFIGRVMNPLKE